MLTLLLFISWYYQDLPKKALNVWKNFLWFWGYYFSFKDLLLSFFSPWRKYRLPYGKRFDIKEWFSAFTFNIFSRFIGALFRGFLILLGLIFEVFTFFLGVLFFILWPIFPFLLVFCFALGISLL